MCTSYYVISIVLASTSLIYMDHYGVCPLFSYMDHYRIKVFEPLLSCTGVMAVEMAAPCIRRAPLYCCGVKQYKEKLLLGWLVFILGVSF
jgi:hypothetical protein